jgi:hypothetical protein
MSMRFINIGYQLMICEIIQKRHCVRSYSCTAKELPRADVRF